MAQTARARTFDRSGTRPAVSSIGHHPKDVADELKNGGLVSAAPADDAVQAVAKLESLTVEKPSGCLQSQDAVVWLADVLIVFACRGIAPWQFLHPPLLRWDWSDAACRLPRR